MPLQLIVQCRTTPETKSTEPESTLNVLSEVRWVPQCGHRDRYPPGYTESLGKIGRCIDNIRSRTSSMFARSSVQSEVRWLKATQTRRDTSCRPDEHSQPGSGTAKYPNPSNHFRQNNCKWQRADSAAWTVSSSEIDPIISRVFAKSPSSRTQA